MCDTIYQQYGTFHAGYLINESALWKGHWIKTNFLVQNLTKYLIFWFLRWFLRDRGGETKILIKQCLGLLKIIIDF